MQRGDLVVKDLQHYLRHCKAQSRWHRPWARWGIQNGQPLPELVGSHND